MSTPNTIKVKPWGDGQGDFVLINEGDFDAAVHQLHDEALAADTTGAAGSASADGDQAPAQAAPAAKTTRKARAAALAADTTEG